MNIGIVILATNSYFVLGIRFIKKFIYHYKGTHDITFYFFSDTNPHGALPDNIDVKYNYLKNESWTDGTNLKFKSIISLEKELKSDYLFYFDADTNINNPFTEEWFIGDMVGGQHYGDENFMKEVKGFDRNPQSQAYVPFDTSLLQIYFYGAFFGGKSDKMIEFCNVLKTYQEIDKLIPYEPSVNDESYINKEFHFNPPSKVVLSENFMFEISDKGGIGETRDMNLNVDTLKEELFLNKEKLINIASGKIQIYDTLVCGNKL
jgi:hypothetical protein